MMRTRFDHISNNREQDYGLLKRKQVSIAPDNLKTVDEETDVDKITEKKKKFIEKRKTFEINEYQIAKEQNEHAMEEEDAN